LQSIMPAPVASRSFFTSAAEIVAMSWVVLVLLNVMGVQLWVDPLSGS
jgi:hypothetical protein